MQRSGANWRGYCVEGARRPRSSASMRASAGKPCKSAAATPIGRPAPSKAGTLAATARSGRSLMTYVDDTAGYRSFPVESGRYSILPAAQAGTGVSERGHWLPEDASGPSQDFLLELAVRRAHNDPACACEASLKMSGLGRIHLNVRHEPSRVLILIRCETWTAYVWLSPKRCTLEQRLTRALGCPTSIQVSADTSP